MLIVNDKGRRSELDLLRRPPSGLEPVSPIYGQFPPAIGRIPARISGTRFDMARSNPSIRGRRQMRVMPIIGEVLRDLRFGARVTARQPGTTAIIIISLALGIGANTMIFSLVNAILLRSLPYPEPERMVALWFTPPGEPDQNGLANAGVCMDLPTRQSFYTHAGCYIAVSGNVADPDDTAKSAPEFLDGEMLTHAATQAIGVRPILGRWFTAEEDRAEAERVILISYDLWQRRYGGTQDVLGKRLKVADFGGNDSPSTVIGVMPEGFTFASATSDYFVPLRSTGRLRGSPARNRWVVARMKPGITLEQAQESANQLARGFEEGSPLNKGWGIRVQPITESVVGFLRAPFQILQATAGLVLLIACANVGGLLLAMGATRQRELAVRSALGSGRWRIVRQLLTESIVLAAAGAAVCLALVSWGLSGLVNWLPAWIPRLNQVGLDGRVLLFTIGVSATTALIFGILPALQASRLDFTAAFRSGDRRSTAAAGRLRLRSTFVVLQISTALVLLTGAGLLVNSLLRLQSANVGFDPHNLTTFDMSFTGRGFFGSTGNQTPSGSIEMELNPRIQTIASEIRERVRNLAGVEAVSLVGNSAPLGGSRQYPFSIEGRQPPASAQEALRASWYPIGSHYFSVLQARVVRGREFTDADSTSSPPVALINETMARRYWPGEDPIGQRIAVRFYNDQPRQIVGIVPDIRPRVRDTEANPQMYVPYAQLPRLQAGVDAFGLERLTFVVRSRARVADWLPAARTAANAVDSSHAITNVRDLEDFAVQQTQGFRQYVILLGVFSGIALLLAVVGIYGVMSHSVAQRTSEIGIRVAFGATARDVLGRVLRQGLVVIAAGMVIGLGASLGLTRVIRGSLFGVTETDPLTFGVVMLTLFLVAFVACWVPARRALKVDPLVAMRHD
jgi:predicted permease